MCVALHGSKGIASVETIPLKLKLNEAEVLALEVGSSNEALASETLPNRTGVPMPAPFPHAKHCTNSQVFSFDDECHVSCPSK